MVGKNYALNFQKTRSFERAQKPRLASTIQKAGDVQGTCGSSQENDLSDDHKRRPDGRTLVAGD